MSYPKTKYKDGQSKTVNSDTEEKLLGPDWKEVPSVGQKYPKAKYHASQEPRLVHNDAEEAALSGWADKPFEKPHPVDADHVTQANVRYLKSLGYTKIKNLEDTQVYVDTLSPEAKVKFYAEAKAWEAEETSTSEKVQAANVPPKPKPVAPAPKPQPLPAPQPTRVEPLPQQE